MVFYIRSLKNSSIKHGFTMIELMVAIAILMISFTLVAVTLRTDRVRRRADKSAGEFSSSLIYARNLALSGKVFVDELDADGVVGIDGEKDVPNGYGVHLQLDGAGDPGEFNYHFIFGDLYSNAVMKEYDNGVIEEQAGNRVDVEARIKGEVDGVFMPLDIFFETGRGKIYFADSNGELAAASLTIVFTNRNDPTLIKSVVINKDTNQIYVK